MKRPLFTYFALAYAISWAVWSPLVGQSLRKIRQRT